MSRTLVARVVRLSLVVAIIAVASVAARAEVRLPAIFSDNAVLQQDAPIKVWGRAEPGEAVTVSVAGQKQQATAGQDGRWQLTLEPLKASKEPLEMVVAGKNTLTLKNLLVGEVWLCSGQSNMEMRLSQATVGKETAAAAADPTIRLFAMDRLIVERPLDEVRGKWVECTPEAVAGFSAVSFYFGREIRRQTDRPVGLVSCAYGGTTIRAWMDEATLRADPEFAAAFANWQNATNRAADANKAAEEAWKQEVETAVKEKREAPARPKPVKVPLQQMPAGCYNGMLHSVVGYRIRGAIWYQGETDAGEAARYRRLLPAMAASWRTRWGQGEFPFLYVQLPGFMAVKPEPSESRWAEFREMQELCLATIPASAMAVTIDLGDPKNIHPLRKFDVGRRLALAAEAMVYGGQAAWQSPLFEGQEVQGDRIRVTLKNAAGGLCVMDAPTGDPAAPPREARPGPVAGFAIAGADKKFVWAEATIDGSAVVVRSDQVKEPKFVRYAWGDCPEANLYSKDALPAGPFRSDR